MEEVKARDNKVDTYQKLALEVFSLANTLTDGVVIDALNAGVGVRVVLGESILDGIRIGFYTEPIPEDEWEEFCGGEKFALFAIKDKNHKIHIIFMPEGACRDMELFNKVNNLLEQAPNSIPAEIVEKIVGYNNQVVK